MQKLKFPKDFLWGAATSAHQVEGNNTNSDWWAWEHSTKRAEELKAKGLDPKDFYSGIACDSYNRFDEDFSLAQHLNHTATRLSVEWARIEPKEGEFSEAELDHYEKVLRSAKYHGLTTFVTLHHFTNPIWFTQKGGFAKAKNVENFVKYATVVTKRLSEYVDFWLTFNEPEIYVNLGFFQGVWPPSIKSIPATFRAAQNLISAHNKSATFIRTQLKKPVSMAFHLSDLQSTGWLSELPTMVANYIANKYFLHQTKNFIDFIGVNYYFHHHIGVFGKRKHSHSQHPETDMGWGIHPDGLEKVLLQLKPFNKPVYITENGLADAKDKKREQYIKDHLFYVHSAINKGVDIKGYLHWSLLDNFEWADGFKPRFGLIEIDREDLLRRKVRYSATKYAEICKNNYLEI